MIYFLAHSDWILYNSRKEMAIKLKNFNYKVSAITTNDEYADELKLNFNNFYEWKVDKFRLIDVKGVRNLRNNLKQLNESLDKAQSYKPDLVIPGHDRSFKPTK